MTGSEDADAWPNCLNSLNLIMTLAGTDVCYLEMHDIIDSLYYFYPLCTSEI